MSKNIKIVILEDNPYDAELLQREIKKAGMNFSSILVQSREAYEEALDVFKPDIILSDYSLPSFDAVAAFRIKQQKCPDTPFIIVSGTIGEEKAVEHIKDGVTDYALKDKLFSLTQKITRALKDAEDRKAKIIADEKLKSQNEKLFEIAFLQSHQVRVPVAHILGLFDLFRFDNPYHPINAEILSKLKISSEHLDTVIKEIVKKTNEIKTIS